MALTIKLLKTGDLPSSKADLVLSPSSKATVIKTISIVNTHATANRTFNLYVKVSGGSIDHRITPNNVLLPAGCQAVFDTEITLGPSDILRGDGGTDLHYVVSGMERDI